MNQGVWYATIALILTLGLFPSCGPSAATTTHTGLAGARELARDGRLAEAETTVNSWLKEHPGASEGLEERGCIHVEQGDPEGAIADLEAVPHPTNRGVLCLAQAYHLAARHQDVLRILPPLLKSGKLNPQGARSLVFSALAMRRGKEALEYARAVRKMFPKDVPVRLIYARALAVNNFFTEAIEELTQTARVVPDNPEVPFIHGNLLWVAGYYPEAVAQYKIAVKMSPLFAEAWRNMGIALIQDAHHEEAIDVLSRALKLVPGDLQTINNLGVALASAGRLDEAAALYVEALRQAPDQPVFLNNLADVYVRSGKVAEALVSVERLVKVAPKRGNALRMHKDLFALKTLIDSICQGEKKAIMAVQTAFVEKGWSQADARRALDRVLADTIFQRWIERGAESCPTH